MTDDGSGWPAVDETVSLRIGGLVLEPLVAAHADEMFGVLSEAGLYRHLDYGPPPSIDHVRATYARLERRASPDGAQRWLNWIVRHEDGAAIGFVQATLMRPSKAWVAFLMSEARQGRGHARAATAAMLEHLTIAYGIDRFAATAEVDNLRSTGLLRRLSFVEAPASEVASADLSPTERLFVRSRSEPS